ncbi:MAG: VOC family protein [Desertimonas sp.]
MTLAVSKDSIDIGIVVRDAQTALAFYRDTLDLEDTGSMPMPGGGGTMYRLRCGTTIVKLVAFDEVRTAAAPPGGIQGAYGYRYWTISVADLDGVTTRCSDAGYKVVMTPREIRAGVRISMVADPDGNWVELLETTA